MFAYKLFNTVKFLWIDVTGKLKLFPPGESTLLCLCFKALEDLHLQRRLIIPRMEAVPCSVLWAACRFASSQGWWWQVRADDDKKPPAKPAWCGLSHIFGLRCLTSPGLIHSAAFFSLFLAKPIKFHCGIYGTSLQKPGGGGVISEVILNGQFVLTQLFTCATPISASTV